ncbi:MAG: glucuronate isomerase [Clostridia bacterium]|nr:glucuronate isomerase [Clostridia bacterium]
MMQRAALAKKLLNGIEKMPTVAVDVGFGAAEISENRPFVTPVELWYKNPRLIRAMRACGVCEGQITGEGADYEKLTALFESLPATAGSTLAQDLFADLAALRVPFAPTAKDAASVWQGANTYLASHTVTPRSLLAENRASLVRVNVGEGCEDSIFEGSVKPLVCFDTLLQIESPDFSRCVEGLGKSTGFAVKDLSGVEQAIFATLDRFAALGACAVMLDLSGFDRFVKTDPYHAALVLARGLAGENAALTTAEQVLWRVQLLRMLSRAMAAHGMRFVLRVRSKTDHVMGDFSTRAFEKLLLYLSRDRALPTTLLSFAAGDLPRGLSSLLDRFRKEDGTPLLYFGIDAAGAASALLSRSLRFYLHRGAASLLLGVTDCEQGCFSAPAKARFARVLSAELARFAVTDGNGLFDESALLRVAQAVFAEQAARFFGV